MAGTKKRSFLKLLALLPAVVGAIKTFADLPKDVLELPSNIARSWHILVMIVFEFGLIFANALMMIIIIAIPTTGVLFVAGRLVGRDFIYQDVAYASPMLKFFWVMPYVLGVPLGILFTYVQPPKSIADLLVSRSAAGGPILYLAGMVTLAVTVFCAWSLWSTVLNDEKS